MKYAVLILDGVTDGPCEELGGKTPLASATLPNLSRLAAAGRVGLASTVPEDGPRSAGGALASLLGYPSQAIGESDAALAFMGSGRKLGERDAAYLLDFVAARKPSGEWSAAPDAVIDPELSPVVTAKERELLLKHVLAAWRDRAPEIAETIEVLTVEGRTLIVDRSGRACEGLQTLSPREAAGTAWKISWPGGGMAGTAEALRALVEISAAVLPGHDVNTLRVSEELPPANLAWIHGRSRVPSLDSITERFGLKGVMFTRSAAARGLAAAAGWEVGEPGDSVSRTGAAAVQALGNRDVVAVHTAIGESGLSKVAALERLDAQLIGPIAERLEQFGDPEADASARGWRLLLAPSHTIDPETGGISAEPTPFLIAGSWIRSVVRRRFDEDSALESDLSVDPGHELMEYFLFGGQARVKAPTRRGKSLTGPATRRGPKGRTSR